GRQHRGTRLVVVQQPRRGILLERKARRSERSVRVTEATQILREFGKPRKTDQRRIGDRFARSDGEQQHRAVDIGADAAAQRHLLPPTKTQLTESTQPVLAVLDADVRCSAAELAREHPLELVASYLVAARLLIDGRHDAVGALHATAGGVAGKRRQSQCGRKCCALKEGHVWAVIFTRWRARRDSNPRPPGS